MEIMNKKLSKFDGIDKLNEKFDKLESEIVYMRKEIDEIKQIQKTQGDILELFIGIIGLDTGAGVLCHIEG
jgi:uncharacterized coiled-coil DUF342 family protein